MRKLFWRGRNLICNHCHTMPPFGDSSFRICCCRGWEEGWNTPHQDVLVGWKKKTMMLLIGKRSLSLECGDQRRSRTVHLLTFPQGHIWNKRVFWNSESHIIVLVYLPLPDCLDFACVERFSQLFCPGSCLGLPPLPPGAALSLPSYTSHTPLCAPGRHCTESNSTL